jgi:hypothetical protein
MRPFFTLLALVGVIHRPLCFGMAPSFVLCPVWKARSRANPKHHTTMTTTSKSVCCTSPAAVCYWCAATLMAWAVLGFVGKFWHPLRWYASSTILLAMGIGCIANWVRNRSFHCSITAPLFLLGGLVFFLADLGAIRVNIPWVWSLLCAGSVLAFLLEWRFARRLA